jgi:hypothetical protein
MEESQSLEELRKQIIGIIDMDGFLIHKKIVCQILMERVEDIVCTRNIKIIAML